MDTLQKSRTDFIATILATLQNVALGRGLTQHSPSPLYHYEGRRLGGMASVCQQGAFSLLKLPRPPLGESHGYDIRSNASKIVDKLFAVKYSGC